MYLLCTMYLATFHLGLFPRQYFRKIDPSEVCRVHYSEEQSMQYAPMCEVLKTWIKEWCKHVTSEEFTVPDNWLGMEVEERDGCTPRESERKEHTLETYRKFCEFIFSSKNVMIKGWVVDSFCEPLASYLRSSLKRNIKHILIKPIPQLRKLNIACF